MSSVKIVCLAFIICIFIAENLEAQDLGFTKKLSNISTRGYVGSEPGEELIAGFVVEGVATEVLVRGIGPALAFFDVSNYLEDPEIELIRVVEEGENEIVATNDDWVECPVDMVCTPVDLFPYAFLLSDGVKDAGLHLTLDPGVYTLIVSGKGRSGVALAEVYLAE